MYNCTQNVEIKNNENMNKIHSLIPHRYPFLFVDEIISYNEKSITTKVLFDLKYDFFKGHYPNKPIVPGVILCENALQSGAILLSLKLNFDIDKVVPVVTRILEVKFKQMVTINDEIITLVEITENISNVYYMKATTKLTKNNKIVMTCQFAVSFVENNNE